MVSGTPKRFDTLTLPVIDAVSGDRSLQIRSD
jgi:hypothetical protein